MIVVNMDDTGELRHPDGSWIDYWKSETGSEANYCAFNGCYATEVEGAHVLSVGENFSPIPKICPLCSFHNQSKFQLEINDTPLAPTIEEHFSNSPFIVFQSLSPLQRKIELDIIITTIKKLMERNIPAAISLQNSLDTADNNNNFVSEIGLKIFRLLRKLNPTTLAQTLPKIKELYGIM